MPYIDIKTNRTITPAQEVSLKSALGEAITCIPGKTESRLMLGFADEQRMYFRGECDIPMAYLEVALFGTATDEALGALTAAICTAFSDVLDIAPENVYVKYSEVPHWGARGGLL